MVSSNLTKTVFVSGGEFLSLVYHDIFDYPLLHEELKKWAVRRQRLCRRREVGSGKLDIDVGGRDTCLVERTGEFYHLPGRKNVVLLRKSQEKLSEEKMIKARYAARVISKISTVLFVGLTGSLAMNNADVESDIDFLIITKKNTLFITRALVHALLVFSAVKRRSPTAVAVKDKVCLNMWMDGGNMAVPIDRRSIYTAHEVLQVVPLVNRENTFEKFFVENDWAGEYWKGKISSSQLPIANEFGDPKIKKLTGNWKMENGNFLLCLLEPLAYRLQLWYMQRRRTRELVSPTRAFFHPIDWGEYVIREWESRIVLGNDSKYPQKLMNL